VKKVMIPLTAITLVASASSFAAVKNAPSTATLSAQIHELSAETKELQHEVWLLKHKKNVHHKRRAVSHRVRTPKTAHNKYVIRPDHANKVHPSQLGADHHPMAAHNPWDHFVTVTTTPFLGKRTDFDGDDLLYNVSRNKKPSWKMKWRRKDIHWIAPLYN
jgi:hypothetical protein